MDLRIYNYANPQEMEGLRDYETKVENGLSLIPGRQFINLLPRKEIRNKDCRD